MGKIFWGIYDLSGIRAIVVKIRPELNHKINDINYRPPSTFILWFFGFYVAFFGLASQRYENRIDIIENRANAIFSQLSNDQVRKSVLNRISNVQNMPCPKKPEILKPSSVFLSLFSDSEYDEMVQLLKETVESWKGELTDVDLGRAKLKKANLRSAILGEASLYKADLEGAILRDACLEEAYLEGAILEGADLDGAKLKDVSGLKCSQLILALNWQTSYRDPKLACGASIPIQPKEKMGNTTSNCF